MKRSVNKELFQAWADDHRPNANTKLHLLTKVPTNSIAKIRSGVYPQNSEYRQSLAEALGVSESELFPPIDEREDIAS